MNLSEYPSSEIYIHLRMVQAIKNYIEQAGTSKDADANSPLGVATI